MSFLSIKLNPAGDVNLFKPTATPSKKLLLLILVAGILNFLAEATIRFFVRDRSFADGLVVTIHLITFVIIPFIITGVPKKDVLIFFSPLFIIFLATNILIKQRVLGDLFNFSYFLSWPVFYWVFTRNRNKLKNIGLSLKKWPDILIYGIGTGLFFAGHLFFVVNLAPDIKFLENGLSKIIPGVLMEVGFGAIAMELFFRGFLFNQIFNSLKLSYGLAAALSTFFYIIPFFTNPLFISNAATLVATIFYTLVIGYTLCYIYKKTESIFAGIIANLIIATFRMLIIG